MAPGVNGPTKQSLHSESTSESSPWWRVTKVTGVLGSALVFAASHSTRNATCLNMRKIECSNRQPKVGLSNCRLESSLFFMSSRRFSCRASLTWCGRGTTRNLSGSRARPHVDAGQQQLSNADPLPAQQAPLRAREAAARAGARDVAHWCEALSHAQPSPFLPLHVPRQRAGPARVDTQGPGSHTPARPPRSFFRRPLSAVTVAYSSEKGRAMLGEVVGKRAGGAVFLDIMTAFEMQRHPVSCGMASLTIALNALKLAPWRGDEGLGGCSGAAVAVEETRAEREADEEEFEMVTEDELSKVLLKETEKKGLEAEGVSLQTLAEVALRINGMRVERLHAEGGTGGGFSQAEFRKVRCSHHVFNKISERAAARGFTTARCRAPLGLPLPASIHMPNTPNPAENTHNT